MGKMSDSSAQVREIFRSQLKDIQAMALATRMETDDILFAPAPGAKRYRQAGYSNEPLFFVHASITGSRCELNCRHCRKRILESMIDVSDPGQLVDLGQRVLQKGGKGMLVSGGSAKDGGVDFSRHYQALSEVCSMGLKVIVHTGIVDRMAAKALSETGISQALIDVIGSAQTIKSVCNLDATPRDYYDSVTYLLEENIEVVPHIVIGLDEGALGGEVDALGKMLDQSVKAIVFVARRPLAKDDKAEAKPADFGYLCAAARLIRPDLKLALGCMRPMGEVQSEFETMAIMGGANAIAFARDEALQSARELGLTIRYSEFCCSLAMFDDVDGIGD